MSAEGFGAAVPATEVGVGRYDAKISFRVASFGTEFPVP